MAIADPFQLALPQLHGSTVTAARGTMASSRPYPVAVILSFFSLLLTLLIIPPMFWHWRNRNIGATVLVGWVVILLLFTFVNCIIWPNDDIASWYNGSGLCDIEVKIQLASEVGISASFATVLRALAKVMDTEHATLVETRAEKRRKYIIDLLMCIGAPLIMIPLYYIVQPNRYYIYGISGCVSSAANSWLTVLIVIVPPVIWVLVDAYYAVLILIRLYRYRLTLNSILASSNTNKSRFLRLYIICIVWTCGIIPVQAYVISANTDLADGPFIWSSIHSTQSWSQMIMIPSNGAVIYDRWIWLSSGILLFVFFGCGREGLAMYETTLSNLGLRHCLPILQPSQGGSLSSKIGSFGSKAKLLFRRRSDGVASTRATHSSIDPSITTKSVSDFSPTASSVPTIGAGHASRSTCDEKRKQSNALPSRFVRKFENIDQEARSSSPLHRISSLFRWVTPQAHKRRPDVLMEDLEFTNGTIHSVLSGGSHNRLFVQHARGLSSNEVLITQEVRKESATAEVPVLLVERST